MRAMLRLNTGNEPTTITPATAYTQFPTEGAIRTATAPAPKSSSSSTTTLATTTWAVLRIVLTTRFNAPPLGWRVLRLLRLLLGALPARLGQRTLVGALVPRQRWESQAGSQPRLLHDFFTDR